ncbi:hypothetical protein Tco_1073052 [Tanacetum coccineum]
MSYNGLSCYLCGDPLDGILCQRCSCGWCGNKLDDGFCSYCASKDGNSFAYNPNPNSFDNSPNFSYPPPQPQFETYSCELCGNDSPTWNEIDEEYERDCEIRIRKLKQDFNEWGSEVRKKEQAYNEEQYSAARPITPDLPIEEPDNSLSMGDEHLDTTPSIENLVPIPSEFEGISDDTSDVPTCDNNRVNVEIDLVESLINRDTSIVYSSKIDPILEEFAGELAHIAPIPPGIVEADFDPNDDTSSDDDDFEDIEYVSFEEVNDVEQEEKEFDLEDILQIKTLSIVRDC